MTTPDEATQPTYPDVTVPLSGEDGNAVAIIARTARAIRLKHGHPAATTFSAAARATGSYDDLLRFVMATVQTT